MVGAQVVWETMSRNGGVEHPTEGDTNDIPCMYNKANDAPLELVHDHEHPVAFQQNGFAPKQINAPEAVLRMPDDVSHDGPLSSGIGR